MIEFNGKMYATDKHEYLLELNDWTPELAQYIASLEQIEMTPAHWEVVNFVRVYTSYA